MSIPAALRATTLKLLVAQLGALPGAPEDVTRIAAAFEDKLAKGCDGDTKKYEKKLKKKLATVAATIAAHEAEKRKELEAARDATAARFGDELAWWRAQGDDAAAEGLSEDEAGAHRNARALVARATALLAAPPAEGQEVRLWTGLSAELEMLAPVRQLVEKAAAAAAAPPARKRPRTEMGGAGGGGGGGGSGEGSGSAGSRARGGAPPAAVASLVARAGASGRALFDRWRAAASPPPQPAGTLADALAGESQAEVEACALLRCALAEAADLPQLSSLVAAAGGAR